MLFVHALIGIGEMLITVAALAFIMECGSNLLGSESVSSKGGIGWADFETLIALAVVVISPLASADPDGLERVAEDMGFIAAAKLPLTTSYPITQCPSLEKRRSRPSWQGSSECWWSLELCSCWRAHCALQPEELALHSDIFDRYHSGESRLHVLDPRVKVLSAVGFILAIVLLPDGAWPAYLLAWGMILAASSPFKARAGICLPPFVRRSAICSGSGDRQI